MGTLDALPCPVSYLTLVQRTRRGLGTLRKNKCCRCCVPTIIIVVRLSAEWYVRRQIILRIVSPCWLSRRVMRSQNVDVYQTFSMQENPHRRWFPVAWRGTFSASGRFSLHVSLRSVSLTTGTPLFFCPERHKCSTRTLHTKDWLTVEEPQVDDQFSLSLPGRAQAARKANSAV